METTVIIILAVVVMLLLLNVISLRSRLAQKSAADAVQIQENVSQDSDLNTRLRQHLKEGNKIKAIKELRMAHSLPLAEAKQYVDRLEQDLQG
ncbi:hypothetical protein [Alkalicoccobacillus plakortidis]|uniref:Ribosomal protein L7/L12 C-terminal domain-containing protein n=1 Tax=Alkalicoccobacillus plakortidis TaxID=444060 RepID=A0ABT0XKT5_9BACI|nr:hypothetical protein [Alkalicoccobacillus plakortidis]MCM2675822.1 hypothetical protein [Alkalicoccobacillus plakortidis]